MVTHSPKPSNPPKHPQPKNHPEQNFFVVTLPGLEDLAEKEIQEWLPTLSTKIVKGGVELNAPMNVGLSLNTVLKIPTRILLRVNEFSCRDFPKLFQTISGMQWSDWIHPYVKLEAHATTHGSRLKMKNRIEETCLEAWQAYQSKRKARVSKDHTLQLFVRLNENRCTLSLDTTGERLHKRGVRQWVGEAPLRESIASALLQMLASDLDDIQDHIQKYQVELVDPMAGSGTFLLEAASRDLPVDSRDFPHAAFRETSSPPPTLQVPRPYFHKLVGFEVDGKALNAARKNLKAVTALVEWIHEDFLQASPLPPPKSGERWVICNPPYGERLKVEGPLIEYYAKLLAQVELVCKPDRACFLLPASIAPQGEANLQKILKLPTTWKLQEKRKFSNGGIPVLALRIHRR